MLQFSQTQLKPTLALASLAFVCLVPASVESHGGFDERIGAADQAIAASPNALQPRLVRAELHRRHGDFAAALRDLDDASRLAPERHKIDYFRGLVYLDAGRSLEAEVALRRFLEQQPGLHPAGREAHARALLKLERPLDAAREYDLAIEQQPVPIPVVTLERVAIDLELRRGATDAALARLERISERSPRREAWLAQRGDILAGVGRTLEAEQSFARALLELEQLSDLRRRTPAMSRLEAEIREGMAGLAELQLRSTP